MTLEEVKLFLRVDSSDEDTLITNLINTATSFVEDILRFPLSDFEENIPDVVNQAILIVIATLFESRQIGGTTEIKMNDLQFAVRNMLEPYRKKVW